MVGSCYCLAEKGVRITWIEGLLDSGSLVEAGIDILGGDFNMVRDTTVDRSDGGLDGMGRSRGLDIWEELERLSALRDAGHQKWGIRQSLPTGYMDLECGLIGSSWLSAGEWTSGRNWRLCGTPGQTTGGWWGRGHLGGVGMGLDIGDLTMHC